MEYTSTRNNSIRLDGAQAILQGISEEGGLFIAEFLPNLGNLKDLLKLDYRELAFYIIEKFFPSLDREGLREAINKAYDDKFTTKDIISIKKFKDINFLELYHGPTLAFKDMALSLLPYLIQLAKEKEGIDKEIVILTATSGDTGKAALEGFANKTGVKIVVFYPEDGVSKIQKLQMSSQEGDNCLVVAIKGNFDNAQAGVKAIFKNEDFKKELEDRGYILSSANSINIGRLVPQIVYYVYSYLTMVKNQEINLGDKINIVVPTGNFGNILAAYYSKVMGLPVNKLICSSNDNKVLTEFFTDAIYDIRRDLILSSSPSMDILVSSNLERLLYELLDQNDQLVALKMKELENQGYYQSPKIDFENFYADYAGEEEVGQAIKEVFKEGNYLIDPHTAVAYSVYKKYKEESSDDTKTLIVSTASPYKFGSKLASSLGVDLEHKDDFDIIDELSRLSGLRVPDNIRNLKSKKIKHKLTIEKEKIETTIRSYLRVGDENG